MRLLALALLPFAVFALGAPQMELTDRTFHTADYPDHLDGAYTGGFGEQTCHACHFDNDVNSDGGAVSLKGIPDSFNPGDEYKLTVHLTADILEIAGFQLAARTDDGNQAGAFSWDNDRIATTTATPDEIDYLQHAEEGIMPTGDNKAVWTFTWTAPTSKEPVTFNISANAGNNDDSAFGDLIFTTEITLLPGNY